MELFWWYEGCDPPHAKERVFPTGTTELVINLCEDVLRVYDRYNHDRFQSFRGSLICSVHSDFFIDTASQASIMGVAFKRGGAFPFLKLLAAELRDAQCRWEHCGERQPATCTTVARSRNFGDEVPYSRISVETDHSTAKLCSG